MLSKLGLVYRYAISDGVPKRSFYVAMVVGTVLNLINQCLQCPSTDREHRQDAWHQIENKAAQKRESDNGKWPRRCGNIQIREWEIHVRHIEGPTVVQNFIGQHSRSTPEAPTAASRSDCYRLAR